jgi:formate transporter
MTEKISQDNITELFKKGSPDCLTPGEVAEKAKSVGIAKANFATINTVLLGIAAGVFIGLGAMLCTVVTTNTGLGFGLTKLIGGLVFCLGLILVVLAGAELFTGNNLLVMGWLSGKISLGSLLKNWGIVYFANFAGALSLVGLMFFTHQWELNSNAVGINAIQVANAKVNLSFMEAFARGILCNALVCLAVWLCFSARTLVDKLVAIIFPITAFVAAGFEHSIANMYFLPMGIVLVNQPAFFQATGLAPAAVSNLNVLGLINNLIPVTLGNIIGGGLLVGALYWATYLRKDQVNAGKAITRWITNVVPVLGNNKTKELAVSATSTKIMLREALAKSLLVRYGKSEGLATREPLGTSGLREVLAKAVLARASGDDSFLKKLAQEPDEVLKDYELSAEERTVLSSGNTEWLESKVSALEDPLGTWITLKLAQNREN